MGGSLLQLVAVGAQDDYLTQNLSGNPQENYFKAKYHKHYNFAIETIEQTLNSKTVSNREQTATITRSGDLITNSYITLSKATFGFSEGDIFDMIDKVEVEIGSVLIDTHYGDWNAIWAELTTPGSKIDGYRNMLVENSGSVDNSSGLIYYPLNFWFCRNPGLALPLISLQLHEVKINIKWGTIPINTNAKLWIDYVFLDDELRKHYAGNSHEYLIEQVQRQSNNANSNSIRMYFNHPVKELIWVNSGSADGFSLGCQFAPIGNSGFSTNNGVYTPSTIDDDSNIKITLNGHDRVSFKEAKYFKIIHPYQHHTRVPGPKRKILHFNTCSPSTSWSLTSQAAILYTAHCYMRILSVDLAVQTPAASSATASLVHGSSLSSGLTVSQTIVSSLALGTADTNTNYEATNSYVSIVPPGHIIGLLGSSTLAAFEGSLTITYEELPRLIGGDRFNPSNIYCYSFALHPEKHQPSGTCNFSRIDAAYLQSNNNFGGSSSSLKIFAINYNVLRIMGGMGSLAFSN